MLCQDCIAALNYTDQHYACPCCGAPFGALICTECYTREGKVERSFHQAVCCLSLDELAGRIIVLYKDYNEQRLANTLAHMIYQVLPPAWLTWANALTWIPVDKKTLRRRGFDHMEKIAMELAVLTGLQTQAMLHKKPSKDQRGLNRQERINNLTESFSLAQESLAIPPHVLLIDDVLTTGSTLDVASLKLIEGGAREVRTASIARAW